MLNTFLAPEKIDLNFKSNLLREMFGENCEEITSNTSKDPSSHDHQNKLALDAKAGFTNGAHTAIATGKKQDDLAAKAKMLSCTRHFAAVTEMSAQNSLSFNLNLDGITLDNSHMIDIREDGVLIVRGDGPESDFRPMTTDELVQVETESGACSIGFTEEQEATQEYLSGTTNEMPEYLKDLAGPDASTLTRDELAQIVNEKFKDNQHIANRMTSDVPLTPSGLNTDMNIDSLMPERTGTSATPAQFVSPELNKLFGFASNPESAPQQSPIPTPVPAMTMAHVTP